MERRETLRTVMLEAKIKFGNVRVKLRPLLLMINSSVMLETWVLMVRR